MLKAVLDVVESAKRDSDKRQFAVAFARATYPDFDEVVNSPHLAAITGSALDIIVASDYGAHIVYELGNNEEESNRIAALPSFEAASVIRLMETMLSSIYMTGRA